MKTGSKNVFSLTTFATIFFLIISALIFTGCGAEGLLGLNGEDFDFFGGSGDDLTIIAWSGISPGFIGSVLIINIDCGNSGTGGGGSSDPETSDQLALNADGTGTYGILVGRWIYVSETEPCDSKKIIVNGVQVEGIRFTVSGGEVILFAKNENGGWSPVSELEGSGEENPGGETGPGQLM